MRSGLIDVYMNKELLEYVRWRVDKVSTIVTNTDKLEARIFKRLQSYVEHKNNKKLSWERIRYIIGREIKQVVKQCRNQQTILYSDLAVTNESGNSLMYEPVDEMMNVCDIVLENIDNTLLKTKIARLASDDFERHVLTEWSLGKRSIDIAKGLAAHSNHDVAYFKLKVARFKKDCKKRYNRESLLA